MKYTKEAIKRMKSDHWLEAMCLLCGRDIDDVIAESEAEYPGDGDLDWSREKGTIKIPKSDDIVTYLKVATPKESMVTPKFPIKKEDYDFLVKCAVAFNDNITMVKRLGFSDIDTKDLTLVGAPLAMIYTLLRTLVDPNFAGRFMAGISNEGPDYFYRLYDEQTRI